jgi:phage terminase large subunit
VSVVESPAPTYPPDAFLISKVYRPWAHQILFHASSARFRLQIGGYGSGKSRPLLWEGIFHALEYPGSNSIILRKTIPDLKRTVIDKFLSDVPEELYQSYHETDKIVYFHPVKVQKRDPATGAYERDEQGNIVEEEVQSKLYFGACEREKDISKFLSTEYVYIGFEELGEFPFLIWDAFEGRNRCPIYGSRSCMAGATNPMGIGYPWIRKVFIEKQPFRGMDPEKYNPADYEYFHSTVDMNPIYSKNKEYLATLEKSPLRDRIRYGKLDVVSGNYFDNFDATRHVRPAEDFIFQDWQPVWVGWDWGFAHYSCVTFWTKAILKPRVEHLNKDLEAPTLSRPKVVNVCIRELIMGGQDDRVGEEQTPEQQVKAIIAAIPRTKDREGNEGYAWNIESIHFSWERFQRTVGNYTVADQVTDLFQSAGLPAVTRSNTDRIAGWTKMYSLLDLDELFLLKSDGMHRGCPILAESLPLLVRGDGITTDLEDVVKPKGRSLEDDIGDSARYACAGTLLDPEEMPEELRTKQRLASIKDPVRRHMEMYKDYLEKTSPKRENKPGRIIPSWQSRLQQSTQPKKYILRDPDDKDS